MRDTRPILYVPHSFIATGEYSQMLPLHLLTIKNFDDSEQFKRAMQCEYNNNNNKKTIKNFVILGLYVLEEDTNMSKRDRRWFVLL